MTKSMQPVVIAATRTMLHTSMRGVLAPLLACLFVPNALAGDGDAKLGYSLRDRDLQQGSIVNESLSSGAPYPLKRRYSDFTKEEKAALRKMYEGMPEDDEPPFPADGMRYIVADVAKIAGGFNAKGVVSIHVSVDEKGEATGVKVMHTPSLEVAKGIALVLIKTKYKPAVCGGSPCASEFPFRFELQ